MDKDLINIEIENMVKQIVDTLENHNPSDMRPDGFLDGRFYDLIQEAITSAIHSIADDLSYKFKINNYSHLKDGTD